MSRGDVRKYPFIGKGAEITGIIFVNKESKASKSAAKQAIGDALKAGKSIMIYPEEDGCTTLDSHLPERFFDLAAELNVPVIPFIMEYKSLQDYWIIRIPWQVIISKPGQGKTVVRLSIGDVIHGDNSWALLRQSQQWMNDEIIRVRSDWGGLSQGQGEPRMTWRHS